MKIHFNLFSTFLVIRDEGNIDDSDDNSDDSGDDGTDLCINIFGCRQISLRTYINILSLSYTRKCWLSPVTFMFY